MRLPTPSIICCTSIPLPKMSSIEHEHLENQSIVERKALIFFTEAIGTQSSSPQTERADIVLPHVTSSVYGYHFKVRGNTEISAYQRLTEN